MLWRLHIRPNSKNGKKHNDVVSYCFKNKIAGIGWPIDSHPTTKQEYEQAARSMYGSRCAAIQFVYAPAEKELVWARTTSGKYYLGCFKEDWQYSSDPLHLELDIPNQRECHWVEIGNEEYVPGKIVASFRSRRAFQAINEGMIEYSQWLYQKHSDQPYNSSETLSGNIKIDKSKFFQFIGAEDCEDVVGLYLQKVKGYCLIPSSCKQDTIGHEYILKHSYTGETAIAQVKQGNINLDETLNQHAKHVYLFTSEGNAPVNSDNVTVLTSEELFSFVIENQTLLPERFKYWLEFLHR